MQIIHSPVRTPNCLWRLDLAITEPGSSRILMDQDVRDLCITLGKLSCIKPVAEVLRKVYPRVSRKARYTEFILDCPQI